MADDRSKLTLPLPVCVSIFFASLAFNFVGYPALQAAWRERPASDESLVSAFDKASRAPWGSCGKPSPAPNLLADARAGRALTKGDVASLVDAASSCADEAEAKSEKARHHAAQIETAARHLQVLDGAKR
jgi:hypothetical protein